ncbi:MAG: hypothetical protein J6Z15_03025 [Oscillospiraceae bacterium]|nr:hypothetical protein [Oscillospiraceae bacterium]MBP5239547.1 hypothetical protein [Oscillospiraceae bacterium]MBP5744018.1 hypothetical protein [Oscillospiraceae bacterium]
MDENLRELLEKDEKLLWSGQPEQFEALDRTNRQSIITGLILKVAVTLGLIILYILIAVHISADIKPGIVAALLIVCAAMLANPFLVAKRLRNNTIYGLTDRRILRAGAKEDSVDYERIKNAALRIDADGHMSLLCGPRAKNLRPQQWRVHADAAFVNRVDEPECVRLILYALPMNEELKTILEKHFPIS